MSSVEREAKKKRTNRNIQLAALATLAVGGVIAVGAVAPNTVQLLAPNGRKLLVPKYQFASVLARLRHKRLIEFELGEDGRSRPRLTLEGDRILSFGRAKMILAGPRVKKWDKRWRMVIFDIPERRRRVRDRFRIEMQEAGFFRLQDSVWVYPHECEEFIALLKVELHTEGSHILYAVVEHIESDRRLRAHFGLT